MCHVLLAKQDKSILLTNSVKNQSSYKKLSELRKPLNKKYLLPYPSIH
jgi:hypothetical protein